MTVSKILRITLLVILFSFLLVIYGKQTRAEEFISWENPLVINIPNSAGYLQFCSQGNSTFAVASNNTVLVYSFSGELVWELTSQWTGNVFSVSISPDDKFLAIGTDKGELLLYNMSSKRLLWKRFLPNKYVRSISIASNRITVGNENTILVYNLNGNLLWSQSGFPYIYQVKIYKDLIIVGAAITGEGKNLYELSIIDGSILKSFRVGTGNAELIDVSSNGMLGVFVNTQNPNGSWSGQVYLVQDEKIVAVKNWPFPLYRGYIRFIGPEELAVPNYKGFVGIVNSSGRVTLLGVPSTLAVFYNGRDFASIAEGRIFIYHKGTNNQYTKTNESLNVNQAKLSIFSVPEKSKVYINGTYKGLTPLVLNLTPGAYEIKLSKQNYRNYTTSIILTPKENKTLKVELTPTFGYLSVDSSPSGAKVYIDGNYAGETPLSDYKLSPGEHTVRIVKDGYEEFTRKVTVSAGEMASVTASLIMITTTTSSTSITTSSATTISPTQTVQATTGGIPKTYVLVGLLVLGLIGGVAVKAKGGKPKSPPSPGETARPSSTPARKPEPRTPPRVPGFPPELLEKYEPLEFLGEGGFAKVFKVKRRSDGKIIALKVSRLDEKARKFFLKEVKAWRLLDHPNIVKLYNAYDEPLPHLEIEFVDGVKLNGEVIRDLGKYPKPVGEEKALHFIMGIAEGLRHAHSKQVYHRDLKPQNVLITSDLTPKITDWGLAKVGAVSTTATTTKGLTLLYAAPEQLDDETYGHTDARTDIYQLGLIFYELLTGKLPYQGTSPAVVMAKVINPDVKPKPPSHFNKALAKYDGIFEKLLAKKKEDRYGSVEEFLSDLELLKKLEAERARLAEEIEKTKTTMSLTTDSRELKKLRRQLVEQLSRNALLLAQLNDKAELINALEDLKAFSKTHRNELENAISQLEIMMRESVPISKSTLDELKVLLHKVQKEVEE